jgi:hypothetical protein
MVSGTSESNPSPGIRFANGFKLLMFILGRSSDCLLAVVIETAGAMVAWGWAGNNEDGELEV